MDKRSRAIDAVEAMVAKLGGLAAIFAQVALMPGPLEAPAGFLSRQLREYADTLSDAWTDLTGEPMGPQPPPAA